MYDVSVKRLWIRVMLLLLIGAIVNVVVAWGCCMFGYRDAMASVQLRRAPNADDLAWWRSINAPAGVNEPFEVGPTHVAGYVETRYLGHGPIVNRPGGGQHEITSSANWNEAGWPLLSLRGVWFGIPNVTTGKWRHETRGALRNTWVQSQNFLTRRSAYVPWHPKWRGFAINTLFYAAILWMLFAAPFALRRRQRIKHGLCPKCAYDLRGNQGEVCPECGAATRT